MGLEIESAEFKQGLERLAKAGGRSEAAQGLNEIGAHMDRVVGDRIRGYSRSLARSIQVTKATGADPVVRIGSVLPYAKITHYGGVIKPGSKDPDMQRRRVNPGKTPKFLTIPLSGKGASPWAGSAAKGARARDYPDTFVFKSKSGKLFIAQKTSTEGITGKSGFRGQLGRGLQRGGKGEKKRGFRLLFLLVRSVTIKAKPYLYWAAEDVAYATGVVMDRLKKALGK